MSPGFNAVTTKGSEVPKIMGYLKYPGGGRKGDFALATVPFLLPSSRAGCAEDTEGTEGTGWVGSEKRQIQELQCLGGLQGGKGKRGRKATAWKGREPHGRFSEKKEGM